MLHETTAPTSIHPRATTRHRFVRLAGVFPSCFLDRPVSLPSRCSHKTRSHLYSNHSFVPRHWLATLLISPQHHSNPIGSGFLQVAVSKAPAHPDESHDCSQGRFRYSPKTFHENNTSRSRLRFSNSLICGRYEAGFAKRIRHEHGNTNR